MKRPFGAESSRIVGPWRHAAATAVFLSWVACQPPTRPAIDISAYPEAVDLTSNHLPVLVRAATRYLDIGTEAARGHLLDGWSGDERLADGTTFAWGVGPASTLRFDVLRPSDSLLVARVWPYRKPGTPRQEIHFELNGQRLGTRRLKPGLRSIEIRLPAEAQVRGVNQLTFRYGQQRTPEAHVRGGRAGQGTGDLRALAVAWDKLTLNRASSAVATARVETGALFLPFDTEISFFFRTPGETVLAFSDLEITDRRDRLSILSRSEGGPSTADPRWITGGGPGAVALEVEPERLTRITLIADSGGREADSGGITIRHPTLHGREPVSAPPGWAFATSRGDVPDRGDVTSPPNRGPATTNALHAERPNVIVYLVDTLRADHLGCYGYPRPTSPEIDAFASGAVLFERTMAQSSWTRSSVASLLTGSPLTVHGVLGRDDALAENAMTLAELLSEAGYATAAFITNGNVGKPYGFAQGFSRFELLGLTGSETLHSPAGVVNRAVFDWLGEEPREPFFLYIHTMEPHGPYMPTAAAKELLAPGVEQPVMPEHARDAMVGIGLLEEDDRPVFGSVPWIQALDHRILTADPQATQSLIALYDAEIRVNDRAFGELLDRLRALELYQRSLIVFVSDHGEEFLDHDGWSHGKTLYQEQVGVPLIVKFPGAGAPRGVRIEGLATQLDLVPTVTDLLDLDRPPDASGRSLLRVTSNDSIRPGYAQLELDGRRAESLIEGRWKLICKPCRMYDLVADPGEKRDLASEYPVRAGYLEVLMNRFRGSAVIQSTAAIADPEILRQLEALGY